MARWLSGNEKSTQIPLLFTELSLSRSFTTIWWFVGESILSILVIYAKWQYINQRKEILITGLPCKAIWHWTMLCSVASLQLSLYCYVSLPGIEGLSVERLTLLGRVHAARVVVDTLTLFPGTSNSLGASSRIPRKIPDNATVRGKPPRPQIKR